MTVILVGDGEKVTTVIRYRQEAQPLLPATVIKVAIRANPNNTENRLRIIAEALTPPARLQLTTLLLHRSTHETWDRQ
jgi:hypothetical protein